MKFGVSTYSYQAAYEAKEMNLEDELKAMKALPGNVNGLELLANRTGQVPQTRYIGTISPEDMQELPELLAKYDIQPICYDSCLTDPNFRMTKVETICNPSKDAYQTQLANFKNEIDFMEKYGFTIMRAPTFFGIYEEVMRDSMVYAAEKGIKLSLEVHAPLHADGEIVNHWLEMADKACPGAASVTPDFGIYTLGIHEPALRWDMKNGADAKVLDEICAAYATDGNVARILADHAITADDPRYSHTLRIARSRTADDPEKLRTLAPYIDHVHAKFYNVTEDYVESGIDFVNPLKILQDIGFEGYLSTEFEGQRYTMPEEQNEVEQVRRMMVMCQKLLGV